MQLSYKINQSTSKKFQSDNKIIEKEKILFEHIFQKKMDFTMIILTIGIPGAGKTTWVKEYRKKHPLTYVVSTDEIRKELTGKYDCVPSENTKIHDEARKRVKQILEDRSNYVRNGFGPEVIVDSTNVDVLEWIKYKALNPTLLLAKVFDVTPEQAMKNQESRSRKVPMNILRDKWETLQNNKGYIPHLFNLLLD